MKDRSDNPLHHERTLLPQSYILLPINDVDHPTDHASDLTYTVGYAVPV